MKSISFGRTGPSNLCLMMPRALDLDSLPRRRGTLLKVTLWSMKSEYLLTKPEGFHHWKIHLLCWRGTHRWIGFLPKPWMHDAVLTFLEFFSTLTSPSANVSKSKPDLLRKPFAGSRISSCLTNSLSFFTPRKILQYFLLKILPAICKFLSDSKAATAWVTTQKNWTEGFSSTRTWASMGRNFVPPKILAEVTWFRSCWYKNAWLGSPYRRDRLLERTLPATASI